MKKGILFLVFFTLIFLSLMPLVLSAQCYVATKSYCQSSGNAVVAGLSSVTNGHGELGTQNNYNNVLCCDFSAGLTCSGSNKVLGLSSATNAHAEIPTQNNYNTGVCYADLSCVSTSYSCGSSSLVSSQYPFGLPIRILSLSSYTNAHLGVLGSLDSLSGHTNICCTSNAFITSLPNYGNGIIDIGETCDGSNFNGLTCPRFDSFTGGSLTCTSIGQIDTSQCTPHTNPICGDGTVESSETCDTNQFNGLSCGSFGFGGGSLSCSACQINTSQCIPASKSWWTSDGNNTITTLAVLPSITKVKSAYTNKGLSAGTSVNFDIYEDDGFFPRDFIKTITATTDSNGKAVAEWTIKQTDLDKTPSDYSGFYFTAKGTDSGFLALSVTTYDFSNVTLCGDYTVKEYCESDIANIALNSINGSVDCYGSGVSCFCSWDALTGKCGSTFAAVGADGTVYGTCHISEQQTDPNGCNDGFLTLSWAGNWSWADGNTNHTDPNGFSQKCINGGTKTIECPAQVQLPFFGMVNIIAALLIIAGIYLLWYSKKKPKKKSRRKK